MLGKSLTKKLSEHNWQRVMQRETNPTQTWIRTRTQAQRGIDHLKILANTLPDDKQEQIFSIENMAGLLESILRQPTWADSNFDTIDVRRSKLAAVLAEKSLNKCIDRYKKLEQSKEISKLVVTRLQESIGLCKDIAVKVGSVIKER